MSEPSVNEPSTSEPRRDVRGGVRRLPARTLVGAVQFYRSWISPMSAPSCRFDPSCSAYAVEALQTHGALRGVWLAVVRVIKCAPWHPGGWDPVPPHRDEVARGQAEERAGQC